MITILSKPELYVCFRNRRTLKTVNIWHNSGTFNVVLTNHRWNQDVHKPSIHKAVPRFSETFSYHIKKSTPIILQNLNLTAVLLRTCMLSYQHHLFLPQKPIAALFDRWYFESTVRKLQLLLRCWRTPSWWALTRKRLVTGGETAICVN